MEPFSCWSPQCWSCSLFDTHASGCVLLCSWCCLSAAVLSVMRCFWFYLWETFIVSSHSCKSNMIANNTHNTVRGSAWFTICCCHYRRSLVSKTIFILNPSSSSRSTMIPQLSSAVVIGVRPDFNPTSENSLQFVSWTCGANHNW